MHFGQQRIGTFASCSRVIEEPNSSLFPTRHIQSNKTTSAEYCEAVSPRWPWRGTRKQELETEVGKSVNQLDENPIKISKNDNTSPDKEHADCTYKFKSIAVHINAIPYIKTVRMDIINPSRLILNPEPTTTA